MESLDKSERINRKRPRLESSEESAPIYKLTDTLRPKMFGYNAEAVFHVHKARELLKLTPNEYMHIDDIIKQLPRLLPKLATYWKLAHKDGMIFDWIDEAHKDKFIEELKANERIHHDGNEFVYWPEYEGLRNKDELLSMLKRRFDEGHGAAKKEELLNSFHKYRCKRMGKKVQTKETLGDVVKYINKGSVSSHVTEDFVREHLVESILENKVCEIEGVRIEQLDAVSDAIDDLHRDGKIYVIPMRDSKARIFWRDSITAGRHNLKFDDAIVKKWKEISIQSDAEIEAYLKQHGKVFIPSVAVTRQPKPKKARVSKTGGANKHMMAE